MKKLWIRNAVGVLLFVLFTCQVNAQDHQPSIQVYGVANFNRAVDRYTAEIILTNANYDYEGYKTRDEMRTAFLQFVVKNGLRESAFKEDSVLFFMIDGYGEGTLFKFESDSVEEFAKLAGLHKLRIARINTKRLFYKPLMNTSELAAKALEDARKKAEVAAAVAGRKLGKILEIADGNNFSAEAYNYYNYEAGEVYQLSVKFGLE